MQDTENEMEKWELIYKKGKGEEMKNIFVGWAFISFQTEIEKELVLDKYHFSYWNEIWHGKKKLMF